ncbi:MAG: serine hydroxymethyltransferase [Planctomycetes bacterium]|nr:serine hydroxymethyltransferase [Planctomycetota bacterium]
MNQNSTSSAAGGVPGRPSVPAFSSDATLDLVDPRIAHLIAAETERQRQKLVFIASESLCPKAVRDAVASPLSNLYAEGYPSSRNAFSERELLDWDERSLSFYRRYGDRRYYKGCDYANLVEAEAIKRLAELFATPATPARSIYCNVQSLSGAAANNAVYEALVPIESTVMGMHLSTGGHLTHGSPVNRSGKHYRIVPYVVDPVTGLIDFDKLRADALKEKPRLLIAGYSAYPWTIDWARFRAIADEVGAYLLADIAHPAGLVAAGEFPNPIDHAHVVSFTTHKTLCGPRGAVILTRDAELARKIDLAVFPGEQGGPHLNAIAGKAVAFRLAQSDEFRRLMKRVRENAAALAAGFSKGGLTLAYGGTDTHLCLVDLRPLVSKTGEPVAADPAARVLDLVGITCNKNSIHGDTRALYPSGLRFGTCWVSQRGMDVDDMGEIATIVTDVLTSMQAFQVHTAAGLVGRVRLPASVLRDSQRRVKKLTERRGSTRFGAFSYPHYEPDGPAAVARAKVAALANAGDDATALEQGAALVDTTRAPAILVTGERAGEALQLALSGDLLRLPEGGVEIARAHDPEGRLIGEFRTARLGPDRRGFEQYLLTGDIEAGFDLLQWLRDLSDGVVAFDADLLRKIDGPIVVEDVGSRADPRRGVLLTVAGPKAAEALSKAGLPGDTAPGRASFAAVGDPDPAIVMAHDLGGARIFEIVVPAGVADALARKLLANCKPVNDRAYSAWRAKRGAPKVGAVAAAGRKDGEKPWFIGQQALLGGAPNGTASGAAKEAFVPPAGDGVLQKTALNEWHKKATKKWNIVDFAGFEMPVLYTSIVDEHRAVRTAAGLFDVSHMGCYEVRGRGAGRFLDLVTTNYVGKLRDGDGQYSYTLAPDGHVLDDLIVYRRDAVRYLVIVNAGNAVKVEAWWRGLLAGKYALDTKRPAVGCDVDVELVNLKDRAAAGDQMRVDIALQGPASLPTLLDLCDDAASRHALSHLKRFGLAEVRLRGDSVLAARTGYTGEDIGFELYIHPDRLVAHWDALLAAGKARGVIPTALGARDSTRTEAGFPLYGHELAGEFDIGPHGAGYPSFVKFHKPFFVGRDALLAREASRTSKIFRARVTDPKARPARAGDTVVDAKGTKLGKVTSAAFAGADQILLLWLALGDKNAVAKGAKVSVLRLPRDHETLPPEPAKGVGAEILTRFLGAGEKGKRSYVK